MSKGQHSYFVKRCTLVSLQVEKEHLQIFRIINNSLHRCQRQDWTRGSRPQPVARTLKLRQHRSRRPPTSILAAEGASQKDFQSFQPRKNLSYINRPDFYFRIENPLNSLFKGPEFELQDISSSRMMSLNVFNNHQFPSLITT